MNVAQMNLAQMTRVALLVTLVAACTPSLRPAPSGPMPTVSTACLDAWVASIARPTDSVALEAPMRSCGSLEEFVAGDEAAGAGGRGPVNPKLAAQELCATGRFNDTAICGQLGITPAPG